MRLELLKEGRSCREVIVSPAAERHLTAGLRRRSIGSAIGNLDSASLRHRREAGLRLERTGDWVPISFDAKDVDVVRNAWGRRVEVSGVLERDADHKLIRIKMQRLEILGDRGDSPPLTDLVGLDEDLTGGVEPSEYLREIRGDRRLLRA